MAFVLSTLLLVYKLVQLQLVDDSYKRIAESTVLDKQVRYPSRGNVYDRNGKILTYNKPIYDLESIYKNVDKDMDTTLFCSLLEIDRQTFMDNIEKDWRDKRYHKSLPHTFLSKISPEKYSKFQEQLFRFPGFYPVIRNIRAYPHDNAAHLLGYLGEADMQLIAKGLRLCTGRLCRTERAGKDIRDPTERGERNQVPDERQCREGSVCLQ